MNSKVDRYFGVQVAVEFSAAHHIRGYDGDCARPHGHNYRVLVEAVTSKLNKIGIAVDFKILKRLLNQLCDKFDHQDLNTLELFKELNPTAETIAQFIFEELELKSKIEAELKDLKLKKVTVWENERSCVSYGEM